MKKKKKYEEVDEEPDNAKKRGNMAEMCRTDVKKKVKMRTKDLANEEKKKEESKADNSVSNLPIEGKKKVIAGNLKDEEEQDVEDEEDKRKDEEKKKLIEEKKKLIEEKKKLFEEKKKQLEEEEKIILEEEKEFLEDVLRKKQRAEKRKQVK